MKSTYQQYRDFKARDPDRLYLFRLPDCLYYETIADDCDIIRSVVGNTTWTTRVEGEDVFNVALILESRLESTLAVLVAAGHRVAVCERVQGGAPKGATVERVKTDGRPMEDDR